MNERIKELVKQSGGEVWQRLENDIVNPEAYITFDPPESLEKFAELIVRECVGIADEYDGVGSTIVSRIKQHFGVDGMSTEDKKILIKELLGVKNERSD